MLVALGMPQSGTDTVSYTHLDVYKRQMLYYSSVVKTMAQIKNLRKIKKLLTKAMIHDKLIELLMSNKK